MLRKIVCFLISFFAILGLLVNYYFYFIYPNELILISIIILSLIISTIITIKQQTIELPSKKFIALISLIAIIFFFIILPAFIFPFTSSDFINHTRTTRIFEKTGMSIGEFFSHGYPYFYYGITATIQSIIMNSAIVNSIFPILIHLITITIVFLLGKKLYGEKIGLIASFLYGLALSSFWLFVAGYLPQMFGTMFLISAIYFYLEKNKLLTAISSIGIITFPHFILIFLIFMILEFFKEKDKTLLIYPLIPIILMPHEAIGLFFSIILKSTLTGYLIRGGISTPNIISLIPFIFAIPFGLTILKNRKKHSFILNLSLAISLYIASVFVRFLLNLFTGTFTIQIHQFYMAVKAFYLLIIPLSIIASKGMLDFAGSIELNLIKISWKKILIISILLFYFIYAANYSLIIKNNETMPSEFYTAAEKLDLLEPNFTISIDKCFMQLDKYTINNFPYNSLIDSPDKITENQGRYLVASRSLQFYWTKKEWRDNFYAEIINDNGQQVVFYEFNENADYLITDCSTQNKPLFFKEGNLKVYKMK